MRELRWWIEDLGWTNLAVIFVAGLFEILFVIGVVWAVVRNFV